MGLSVEARGLSGVGLGALDGFDGAHNPWFNKTPANVPSVLACGRGSEEEARPDAVALTPSLPEWGHHWLLQYSIVFACAGPEPCR